MTTNNLTISKLLEEATRKYDAGDFKSAASDYSQAFDLIQAQQRDASLSDAEKQPLAVMLKQAQEGLQKARAASGTGPLGPPANAERITRLRQQLDQAETEERQLLILQQVLEVSRDGPPVASESERYRKLLERVGRRILTEARQASMANDFTRAEKLLEGEMLRSVAGATEEQAAVRQAMAALQADKGWQAEAAQITAQLTRDQQGNSARVRPATVPTTQLSDPPKLSAAEASARRAEELIAEAERYLRRPTVENYKAALNYLAQALDQAGLSPARHSEIEARRTEVNRAYEELRTNIGQLVTARQIANIEHELITAQVLQHQGIKVDPEDEKRSLQEVISDKLKQLRERLLRVGGEEAARADRLVEDGRNYLDVGALQKAVARYEQVIALLQGKQISSPEGQETAERTTAIQSLQSQLLEYPEIKAGIKTYEDRREAIIYLPELLERVLPIYREAERFYNEKQYNEALKRIAQMRAIIGTRLQSSQFDLLDRYVREAFEAQIAAKLQILLDSARGALARDEIGGFEQAISDLREYEPQFKTPALNELRQQADTLVTEVHEGERTLVAAVAIARQAFTRGDYATAIQEARAILLRRSGNEQARKLLDSAIHKQVSLVLREADQLGDTSTRAVLNGLLSRLQELPDRVAEISSSSDRRVLKERVEEVIKRVEQRIEQQHKEDERLSKLETALNQFEHFLDTDQFEAADTALTQARRLSPDDARVEKAAANLKATWSSSVRRRIKECLDAKPPQPEAALNAIATLEKLAPGDAAELRRRAEQIKAQTEAQAAFDRGDFSAAITLLRDKTVGTTESLELLRKARRREVQRLTELEQWAEVLALLKDMDSAEEGIPGLFRRATGELALRRADEYLRERQFDKCEQALTEVEQQRIDDLNQDAAKLRLRLEAARKVYKRVEALVLIAQSHLQQFEANRNRETLFEAIKQLDKALADPELLPGDKQREQIQQQRDGYQRRYQELITTERRRLLAAGYQSLESDNIAEARDLFRAVQALLPNGEDQEANEGLHRTQRRLIELRSHLVEEVTLMLNLHGGGQRGVMPSDILKKMTELDALRKIEPDTIDVPLNKAASELQEAERLCRQAEEALNAARQRWAALRTRTLGGETLDTKEVRLDLDRGIGHFASRTFIHSDLDRTNIESLSNRLEKDIRELNEANRLYLLLRQGLERETRNLEELSSQFERLRALEENLYQTTLTLIERDRVASVTRPATGAERYPRQHGIIRQLREQIESLQRAELTVPDLTVLRQIMAQRSQIEELTKRLDREQRFVSDGVWSKE